VLDARGEIRRVRHIEPRGLESAPVSADSALALANEYVRRRGWSATSLALKDTARKDPTIHDFRWNVVQDSLDWAGGEGGREVIVRMRNSQISDYQVRLAPPDTFVRAVVASDRKLDTIMTAIWIPAGLVVISTIAVGLRMLRTSRWLLAGRACLIACGLLIVAKFFQLDSMVASELLEHGRSTTWWVEGLILLTGGCIIALVAAAVVAIADEELRRRFPGTVAGLLETAAGASRLRARGRVSRDNHHSQRAYCE
jgi:hypothetical protein